MIFFNQDLNAYKTLANFIETNNYSSLNILCDTNTKKLCLNILLNELKLNLGNFNLIEIGDGEQVKTIETSKYIWDQLLEIGCDRESLLINLGGGVISDIGGFAASVFKRGISFINIPTTLLSMVDASIGGKTGVDYSGVKNIIGTITQPKMTIIDIRYLETLTAREKLSGFAEMLKHGLIQSKKHWDDLIISGPYSINYILLKDSVEIKKRIVEDDPFESGERKLLNFGHSIGHALEAFFLTGNKKSIIKHGEAIAAGMIMESYISMRLELLSNHDFEIIRDTIANIYGIIKINISEFNAILDFLVNDKKNRNSKLFFVLLKGIGNSIYDVEIDSQLVIQALGYYSELKVK